MGCKDGARPVGADLCVRPCNRVRTHVLTCGPRPIDTISKTADRKVRSIRDRSVISTAGIASVSARAEVYAFLGLLFDLGGNDRLRRGLLISPGDLVSLLRRHLRALLILTVE